MNHISTAKVIPAFRKLEYLKSFSEDDFRDKVIGTLLPLKGLQHGKDVCGTSEEGKDRYFFGQDPLAGRILYVVQTKKGDLNLTRKPAENLIEATTQLKTALATSVKDHRTHRDYLPAFALLAASGSINKGARDHIVDQIKDSRISFMDANDLLTEIDQLMPEFWNQISVAKIPYLKNLRTQLLEESQTIDVSRIGLDGNVQAPIVDATFAQLYLHRYRPKLVKNTRGYDSKDKKRKGPHQTTYEKIDVEELNIEQILGLPDRLALVTGDAGTGKTTGLRRLAMILVEKALNSKDERRIPVYLDAKSLLDSGKSLVEYATDVSASLTTDASPAFSVDELNAGHLTVLIDALDEISVAENREGIFKRIATFHGSYPKVQVIVTSRMHPSLMDHVGTYGFHLFYISPISFNQADRMITRLTKGKSLPKEAQEEMLRRLENVHGLELNPLLVTVFVATSEFSRTDIPANITELFKKYTEMMLGRWHRDKTVAQQYESAIKDMLLCQVAYEMHSEHLTSIPIGRFRAIIERELGERGLSASVDILYEEIAESGLVRVQEGELWFRHHMLQEFFAGRGIPSKEVLAQIATDVWWTKAIVFYFGQNPDDHAGLSALRSGIDKIIGGDRFQAAIAVGLACQACYMMRTVHRVEVLKWVVQQLVREKDNAVAEFSSTMANAQYLPFVYYYLYGRDAVAAKAIEEVIAARAEEPGAEVDRQQAEAELFWCIAGLIESHQLEKAEEIVRRFVPKDFRQLMALFIGAYCVERLHVSSDEDKKIAKRITAYLDPLIDSMRPAVIKELKGLLLEVRKGKVAVLDDAPAEQPSVTGKY
jgi:hypothetical protein